MACVSRKGNGRAGRRASSQGSSFSFGHCQPVAPLTILQCQLFLISENPSPQVRSSCPPPSFEPPFPATAGGGMAGEPG